MSSRRYSYAHRIQHWTSYADPEARKGRSGRPYRTFTKRMRATCPPVCCRCGGWIDVTLHHTDPWSWTWDHLDPLSQHGAPMDERTGAPAHRHCNISNQPGRRRPDQTLITRSSQPVATRRW